MEIEKIAIYVEELLEYTKGIKGNADNDITQGQLIGIAEALTILRETCDEEQRKAIGLEEDPDNLIFN